MENDTKQTMVDTLKQYSRMYYLHRNDVRHKKVLRGCKKYYLDMLDTVSYFNKRERNTKGKVASIQDSVMKLSKSLGVYYQNPNYCIYLAVFLFPREMLDAIEKEYFTGLFTRCYNNQIRKKVTTISQCIVKFSSNILKELLSIKEIATLLNYYLENGAQEFYNDEFYVDICNDLKRRASK